MPLMQSEGRRGTGITGTQEAGRNAATGRGWTATAANGDPEKTGIMCKQLVVKIACAFIWSYAVSMVQNRKVKIICVTDKESLSIKE